jgi:hypothetical protein
MWCGAHFDGVRSNLIGHYVVMSKSSLLEVQ